jgi:hypothetical protein
MKAFWTGEYVGSALPLESCRKGRSRLRSRYEEGTQPALKAGLETTGLNTRFVAPTLRGELTVVANRMVSL